MASGPTSTTTTSSKKRPRPEESENDIGHSLSDSPNSSGSRESGESVRLKVGLPREISKWTEEILQGQHFIVSYGEETTPSELLNMFPVGLQGPIKNRQNYFLLNHIDQIETFFLESMVAFTLLDDDFKTLSKRSADYLRFKSAYDSTHFLADMNASSELCSWFQR